ncbi:ribonuclease J [Bosea sp. OAE506]|uniref:ribonuclease J n=1 Tax=Bosea sp. OAE506 TaxID=2663870 RepID=UPI00178AA05E
MTRSKDQLVFVPLGGLGEIGMNAALYGYGPEGRRKWILVDCGLSFAGPEVPGVDIVLPDLRYIVEERANLLGIIITHAHEDHIGALAALWPSLRAPVYCTKFAAGLLATRRLSEPGAPKVPMHTVAQGGRITLGPFDIEFVPVAHSIPESNALAIRTPVGLVVHTGDWKIDVTPQVGLPTDEKRLRELGEEGVLALVCDSTNVMRDGTSPSEADVAAKLKELVHSAPGRVAVTTFASNVARLRAVAEAAMADQREVVVVGRAMDRVIDVARECGYLDGIPAFRSADNYGYLPRDKVVALLTGSQGEPRAALSRIASDDHPEIALSPGDRVIFSSRTIPGNEKAVGAIQNALARDNIEIITDRTHLVHVSGHPRREEMARLYGWLKPKIVIPAHGEDLHLSEHATFARGLGVKIVVRAGNGDVVAITQDGASKVDEVTHGRLYQDGNLLVNALEKTIPERRRLSFVGMISVAVAIDEKGGLAGDPEIAVLGLPPYTRDGTGFDEYVADAVSELIDGIPKARRRDPEALRNALERGLRSAVNEEWGKKPLVHALVIEV